jgi:hypothetical protein
MEVIGIMVPAMFALLQQIKDYSAVWVALISQPFE